MQRLHQSCRPKVMLPQDMEMDWRLGADVFESLLVDHDWAVNTSNWAYFAGAPCSSCCS